MNQYREKDLSVITSKTLKKNWKNPKKTPVTVSVFNKTVVMGLQKNVINILLTIMMKL